MLRRLLERDAAALSSSSSPLPDAASSSAGVATGGKSAAAARRRERRARDGGGSSEALAESPLESVDWDAPYLQTPLLTGLSASSLSALRETHGFNEIVEKRPNRVLLLLSSSPAQRSG